MVKIFVSSTFVDMQDERDIIRSKVSPRLQDYCLEKGTDLSIIDLRWGISGDSLSPEEAMTKILSVCSEEIESCRPFFILIVGSRYGSIPDENALNKFLLKHPDIDPESMREKSITEIEYLYAIKKCGLESKIVVCVRDDSLMDKIPEDKRGRYLDQSTDEKMKVFKKDILSTNSGNIIHYSAEWDAEKNSLCGLKGFEDALTKMLIEKIDKEMGTDPVSKEELSLRRDTMIAESGSGDYVDCDTALNEVMEQINKGSDTVIIKGCSGAGKTSLICKLSTELKKTGFNTTTLFLGEGVRSPDAISILYNIAYRLSDRDITKYTGANQLISVIKDGISSSDKKEIILMDNLNILTKREILELLRYLSQILNDTSYQIVMTEEMNEIPSGPLSVFNPSIVELYGMNNEKAKKIIEQNLRNNGKELNPAALEKLIDKTKFHTPLYVTLATNLLTMLSADDFDLVHQISIRDGLTGGEALSKYLLDMITNLPDKESEMIMSIICRSAKVFGEDTVQKTLGFMEASNGRLRRNDLFELLNRNCTVPLVDVIAFMRMMGPLIVSGNLDDRAAARYSIVSDVIRSCEWFDERKMATSILEYLDALDDKDPVKESLYLKMGLLTDDVKRSIKYLSGPSENFSVIFEDLRLSFSRKIGKEKWIDYLKKVADLSSSLSADKFHSLANQYLFGAFHAINKETLGKDTSQYEILEQLFKTSSVIMKRDPSDKESIRTLYMLAEKMSISTSDQGMRQEYLNCFYENCNRLWEMSEGWEYRDYVLNDLGWAYDKIAQLSSPRFALKLYDTILDTIKANLNPESERCDLLQYQYYTLVCQRAIVELNIASRFKLPGYVWDADGILGEYCADVIPALETAKTYCIGMIDGSHEGWRCHVDHDYVTLYAQVLRLIATYYDLKDDFPNQISYLKESYEMYVKAYSLCDNPVLIDRARAIAWKFGDIPDCKADEKIYYLVKSIDILDGIKSSWDEDLYYAMKEMMCKQLLCECLSVMIPDLDVDDKTFVEQELGPDEIGSYLGKWCINKDNEDIILDYCKLFFKHASAFFFSGDFRYTFKERNACRLMEKVTRALMKYYQEKIDIRVKPILKNWDDYKHRKDSPSFVHDLSKYIDDELDQIDKIRPLIDDEYLTNKLLFLPHALIIYSKELPIWLFLLDEHDHFKLRGLNHSYEEIAEMLIRPLSMFIHYDFSLDLRHPNYSSKPFRFMVKKDGIALGCLKTFSLWIRNYRDECVALVNHKKMHEENWYNIYSSLMIKRGREIMADAETVGKYLIDTIDTIDTRRLIYENDLFECLALDYAFRNGVEEKAKTVISIGYDRYLSIEEMFIIRKYSKKLFLEEMDKLKVICLHHLTIGRKSYMDRYYRDLYGNVFCDELTNISRICISKIDPNNRSDPRNRIKTAVPEWL